VRPLRPRHQAHLEGNSGGLRRRLRLIDRLESILAVKVHMDAQMECAAIRTTDHREGSPQSMWLCFVARPARMDDPEIG
jgi:hypothetical protein